jgi:chorismate mutase-like protein
MREKSRSELSKELKKERVKIDLIDQKLLTLLNQRLRIALEIGKIKKEMGKKIYDPRREKEILDRLNRNNRGPLNGKDLKKIFTTVMKTCREIQI